VGEDVATMLERRGALPAGEAVDLLLQACEAIAEAHTLGVVHRDLKPANLFVTTGSDGLPFVKVLDFGISKLREATRLTQVDVGIGSAEYMSPEQMQSATDVDGRSDIWSLGVTMYELTTGSTPFYADGVGEVAIGVMTREPTPPRELRPDLPPGLESVILRCLQKDPAGRYATARDLAAAIAPFATPEASRPLPAARVYAGNTLPPTGLPAKPAARSSTLTIGVGVGLGVLATAIVVVAFALGKRGGATAGPGRYQLDASTVYDASSKLTWQRTPAQGTMDWSAAKAWCRGQGGGFRLPEASELVGLLAILDVAPPVDPVAFSTTPVDVFWSASTAGGGAAVVVHFSTGRQGTSSMSGRNRVRCVRSGKPSGAPTN
jgi:hypothetical protein